MDTDTAVSVVLPTSPQLPMTSEEYFTLVRRSLPPMLKCLAAHGTPQLDKNIYEGTVVNDMVQKLLYSCSALEMKYAFKEDSASAQQVCAGLEESGFPSYLYIDGLAVDLLHRDATLNEMRSDQSHLKKLILDRMIEEKREPRPMLEELAKRTYLEMLDRSKLFLPYTEGKLIPWQVSGQEKGVRGYLYSWGTFGIELNCAYVHLMYLTQDLSEKPFEEKGDNLVDFLNVMSEEGAHVPEKLHILAKSIDDKLDPIHPKVIKRVRVGSLRNRSLIEARPQNQLSDTDLALLSLLKRAGTPNDFVLFFSEEMTFSKEQVLVTKRLFKKVAQEVFFIPLLDEDADITRYMLMPHRLYQEILPEEAQYIPRFVKRVKFSFDQKGNVNEIS